MGNVIPSLTEVGYISNKNLQMGKLFGYFMAADKSQSSLLPNRTQSLKAILAENLNPSSCASAIESALKNLYGSYFDRVIVYIDQEDKDGGIVNLNIDILCRDNDGSEYRLSREIKTKEGNMVEFESSLDLLYNYYKGQ